jgi:hypothetical protein
MISWIPRPGASATSRLALAVLVVFFAVAPAAQAKGPEWLRICGASECRTFTAGKPGTLRNDALVYGVVTARGAIAFDTESPLAAHYSLELPPGWEDWRGMAWVPEHELVGFTVGWAEVPADLDATLRRATRDLEPKPRPVPSRVTVNGVVVDDPAAYAALFDPLDPAQFPGAGVPAATIRMEGVPEPWVDAARPIRYFPATNVIHRGYGWLQAPDELASVIEDDLHAAATGRRDLPWPAAIALAGLLGAGGWVGWRTFVRRRAALDRA